MTEDEVREIAMSFIAEQRLDPCEIVSVQRQLSRSTSSSASNEWIVQIRFKGDSDVSGEWGLIIVHDGTGVARGFESL